MKTFKDLEFKPHPCSWLSGQQALLELDKGYKVSVLLGAAFYSNGEDTYELAVMKDGRVCYTTPITDDVLGHRSEEEITEAMIKLQEYIATL